MYDATASSAHYKKRPKPHTCRCAVHGVEVTGTLHHTSMPQHFQPQHHPQLQSRHVTHMRPPDLNPKQTPSQRPGFPGWCPQLPGGFSRQDNTCQTLHTTASAKISVKTCDLHASPRLPHKVLDLQGSAHSCEAVPLIKIAHAKALRASICRVLLD